MISSRFEDSILEVCINRAEKKNALNHEMYAELASVFDHYGKSEACKAIIIYGSGGVFTAGADLNDFQHARDAGDSPAVTFLRSLSRAEPPVLAAVEGYAIGIGTTLLLHCDFVYASSDTLFRLPFASLGLCPEGGSSLLLEQVVGRRKAYDWLLSCRFFNGKEAYEAGLINELLAHGETLGKARETARTLAGLPQPSLRLTKSMLKAWSQEHVQSAFDNEAASFRKCLASISTQQAILKTGKVRPGAPKEI